MVRDINPDVNNSGFPFGSSPSRFTAARDIIYFVANDGVHGNELWVTDGTFGGTRMVRDITEGNVSTSFSKFKAVENVLVFVANDGVHGNELWVSLGTAATTYMVKDITEGEASSPIDLLEEIDGTFYFIVSESSFNRFLWKTDGTEDDTEMVLDGDGNGIRLRPQEFIRYKDQLFFRGNNRLWKADGTNEETVSDVFISGEFAAVNDTLYFVASGAGSGNNLWKTDGTAAGTSLVKEITSASFKDIDHLTAGSNHVFFIAEVDEFGRELWASDGTEEGTFMLIDSKPGEEDGFRSFEDISFHLLGDKILFPGFDETHGRELWSSDATIEGTVLVKDINTRSEDIQLYNKPIVYKNQAYFSTPLGLWQTEGTAGNTALLKELEFVFGLNVFNDQLIFTASSLENSRRTIWTSNGTDGGTQPLFEITPESGLSFQFRESLPQINGDLLFVGRDPERGSELWKTDGTEEGTVIVKDLNEGTGDSFNLFSTGNYIVVNNILYFPATDGVLGEELWKTNGTEAGTVPVSDINPFGPSFTRDFIEIEGTIYFSANDGTAGHELWKTDGTIEGTILVKDIYPGDADDNGLSSTSFINFQGNLFFAAQDGEHGKELWKSNGTTEGTIMVKDIYPALNNFTRSSNPGNFFVADGVFFFFATDSTGRKIWKSDGTAEGTQPFQDLKAGSGFVNANGTIFFSANDDEHGTELWKTDGSPEGTIMVYDLIPGSRSASPTILGYQSDVLYFTAIDDINGRELWALSPLSIQTQLTASGTGTCTAGDTVTFTVSATDAGTDPKYLWYINEQLVENQNNTVFTITSLTEGDEVKVQVIADDDVWVLQDSLFSETIPINFSSLTPEITIAGNKLTATEGTFYQWYFEGELLPDTTQTIEAWQSGNYQVAVTNSLGCVALSETTIITITGLEDEPLSRQLKIYPNPAALRLIIDSQMNEQVTVFIYNQSGKKVLESILSPQNENYEVSLSHLTPGLYLVRFVSQQGNSLHKLIKY